MAGHVSASRPPHRLTVSWELSALGVPVPPSDTTSHFPISWPICSHGPWLPRLNRRPCKAPELPCTAAGFTLHPLVPESPLGGTTAPPDASGPGGRKGPPLSRCRGDPGWLGRSAGGRGRGPPSVLCLNFARGVQSRAPCCIWKPRQKENTPIPIQS